MKVDRQKPELIFHAAQELGDPDERERYLRNACEGRPLLKARVEALLKSAVAAEAVFGEDAEPDSSQGSTLVDHPVTEGPGTLIGRYKLVQEIGQGGMGVGLSSAIFDGRFLCRNFN
jgi:eukaryotic-like serine/threonine-protein kinase